MPHAMMVAYVTNTRQELPEALQNYFDMYGGQDCRLVGQVTPWPGSLKRPRIQTSNHERPWPYPNPSRLPGPIALLHLWLHMS
jgi:hypothetical protein